MTGIDIDWSGTNAEIQYRVGEAVALKESELSDAGLPSRDRQSLENDLEQWRTDLRRAHVMSSGAAVKLLSMAISDDPVALEAFSIRNASEKALWMLTSHSRAFRDTELHVAFQAKSNGKHWKKFRIQPGLSVTTDQVHLQAFAQKIASLYKKAGAGSQCSIEVTNLPATQSVQLTVYVQGPTKSEDLFFPAGAEYSTSKTVMETALVYQASTGNVETVVKGGAKNHIAVLSLFGDHVVNQLIDPQQIKKAEYRLNELLDGTMRPYEDLSKYGVVNVRLRRACFVPVSDSSVSIQIDASPQAQKPDAIKLALAALKVNQSLSSEYEMSAATLLVYTKESGKGRAGQFSFDVLSSGSSTIKNLPDRNQIVAMAVLRSLNIVGNDRGAS